MPLGWSARLLTSHAVRFTRQLTTAKYDKLSVGVPKEAWPHERRVAITPERVAKLKKEGVAEVRVQTGAGAESSFTDQAYKAAGATIVHTREEAFSADVVFKVCCESNALHTHTPTKLSFVGE